MMEELLQRIQELENKVAALSDYSKLPLELENALQARGFIKASRQISTTNPYSGTLTLWVANTSGGSTIHSFTIVNGIITTIT